MPDVSLNSDFEAAATIDMGINDSPQNQPFEPETAEKPVAEAPPVEPEPPFETVADPNAPVENAPVSAPASVADAAPPWMKGLIEETNRPANELFKMLRMQQESNQKQAAQRNEYNRLQNEQKQRQQVRDLQRPRPPDYQNATPESIAVYGPQVAAFEARCAREDATMEMRQHLASIEERFTQQAEAQRERDMAAESSRVSNFIDQSMDRFKSDPTTQFMNNPMAQDLFLSRWWSANERAGQMIDPGRVMAQFKSELAAINGSAQTVQKRTEQATIDQNRRNEQAGRGAPNQVRSGGTAPGPAKNADPLDKPWWESGALRIG